MPSRSDGRCGRCSRLVTTQADALRDDIQQLWDDFFIETCQRWVIPYIGDLVGNIPLHDLDMAPQRPPRPRRCSPTWPARTCGRRERDPDPRADVAKTIYYRRRKGTPPMLEELARDVTGWAAHVGGVLPAARLEPAPRAPPPGVRTAAPTCVASTRATASTARGTRRATPSTCAAIDQWEGWYNIRNIGFFLWRLGAYPLTQHHAARGRRHQLAAHASARWAGHPAVLRRPSRARRLGTWRPS